MQTNTKCIHTNAYSKFSDALLTSLNERKNTVLGGKDKKQARL